MPTDARPIGVFDSGIGGLTVLRELAPALPQERFIYFGDDANCPYGPRPENEVRALALAAARLLLARDAKAIVVACNAASVSARAVLRAAFPLVPIIVVVPAVKPAASLTKTGKIILAATARAINDRFTHSLIHDYAAGVTVLPIACPGLVELVEHGQLTGPAPERVIAQYLGPALAAGADVVVLGCTHFPALRAAVQAVVGPQVAVIDSGAAVARQTRRVLAEHGLLAPDPDPAGMLAHGYVPNEQVVYLTSGDPNQFARVASLVLSQTITAQHAASEVIWE